MKLKYDETHYLDWVENMRYSLSESLLDQLAELDIGLGEANQVVRIHHLGRLSLSVDSQRFSQTSIALRDSTLVRALQLL